MSKLKKLGKFTAIGVGVAATGYAYKKGKEYDKKKEEEDNRSSEHQELKKIEKHGSVKATKSAQSYRKDKGIGPKGGKVKFIRRGGRIIPIRGDK